MTANRDIIRAARFGYGIHAGRPNENPDLIGQLAMPDPLAADFPTVQTRERITHILTFRQTRRDQGSDSDAFRQMRQQSYQVVAQDMRDLILRPLTSPHGFRERLFAFWLDHFTVSPGSLEENYLIKAYFDQAIRPHVAGRFVEMLTAVVGHPSMIRYLDQNASFGPNSRAGQRRERGLNENLAREILELHTLGVDGPYTQTDVREFAELLTGLGIGAEGARFFDNRAEPGSEEVLGVTYGDGGPDEGVITEFLHDLAMKPATAQHLARKLAVHFIGPDYPVDLVSAMADEYLRHDGELNAMYSVLVTHPAAQSPLGQKIRQPFEYIVASMRAVGLDPDVIRQLSPRDMRRHVTPDLAAMGQPPYRPNGPDGWPEEAQAWITPPLLASRITWAKELARTHASHLDPRRLLDTVIGDQAPEELSFAVAGAEAKWEGVALMLVSPAFMRR